MEIAGLVIGILGLAGLITLWPKVTLSLGEPLDPSNPFSTPLIISNESWYPVNAVDTTVHIEEFELGDGTNMRDTNLGHFHTVYESLARDEKQTVKMGGIGVKGIPVTKATVSIAISYKPWVAPMIARTKLTRLVFVRGDGGRFQWQFQPMK